MSTLIVQELFPGIQVEQRIRITRDVSVAHIRPWIYKQGTLVDGDLELVIEQDGTDLLTVTIPYTEINAGVTGDFAHGSHPSCPNRGNSKKGF